jgi:hypothetical protein
MKQYFFPSIAARLRAQRGVTLLYSLIALLILLVGAMAVMHSFTSSLSGAGNIAFRRDLVNQGERAVATVLGQFNTGAITTTDSNPAQNYSARKLDVDAHGIPLALLTDDAFASVASSGNDIAGDDSGTQIRYVIDRLCAAEGAAATQSAGACIYSPQSSAVTGGSSVLASTAVLPPSQGLMFRLSVRVSGARDTQVFLQTSFSKSE